MPAVAVRAGDVLAVAKRVVRDYLDIDADRAQRSAAGPEGGADLVIRRGAVVALQHAHHLRLGEAIVATDETEHEHTVGPHDRHCLRGRGGVDTELLRQRLDRRHARCRDLLGGIMGFRKHGNTRDAACDLEIRRIVAVLAGDERVLAGSRRREEVERLLAPHHPRLRLNLGVRDPGALEHPVVRTLDPLECDVEPGLVTVEGVRVLHDELAQA